MLRDNFEIVLNFRESLQKFILKLMYIYKKKKN